MSKGKFLLKLEPKARVYRALITSNNTWDPSPRKEYFNNGSSLSNSGFTTKIQKPSWWKLDCFLSSKLLCQKLKADHDFRILKIPAEAHEVENGMIIKERVWQKLKEGTSGVAKNSTKQIKCRKGKSLKIHTLDKVTEDSRIILHSSALWGEKQWIYLLLWFLAETPAKWDLMEKKCIYVQEPKTQDSKQPRGIEADVLMLSWVNGKERVWDFRELLLLLSP